jgi:hypothetical protein
MAAEVITRASRRAHRSGHPGCQREDHAGDALQAQSHFPDQLRAQGAKPDPRCCPAILYLHDAYNALPT